MISIRRIQARTLLVPLKNPDGRFGVRYTMNLYRGCQHGCIYCDSRSECYQIADFDGEVLVKENAIELLRAELARKRARATISTGAMQDPYMPCEAEFQLTGRALRVIAEFGFPVHIVTKSDLILKDLATLVEINRVRASVCFTLTTTDDELAARIEPGAPSPTRRLAAARALSEQGIPVGITMMPILPFIEDTAENIEQIVARAHECGVRCVVPWFGMSLRQGQREYFYRQLDRLFPGLRQRYERRFGDRYECECDNARGLSQVFAGLCNRLGIQTDASAWPAPRAAQLRLL